MVIAGIVAGGTGSRMGQKEMPKQFLPLGKQPLLLHTIRAFLQCPEVDVVIVGVHKDWLEYTEQLLISLGEAAERVVLTVGGTNRNETVENIVKKAAERFALTEDTVFLTHDAARPFVSGKMIEENIRAAKEFGICGTAIPATDTLLQSKDGAVILAMPDRAQMYQMQTPQSFLYGLFLKVYERMTKEELAAATDVCRLFFAAGYEVRLVAGSPENLKITVPLDLKIAEGILKEKETKE